MALVLILLAYAKIILEEDECQTQDNASIFRRPVERSEPEVPGFRDYARNDTVERSKPEVPGFRDYARNDKVEGYG